MRAANILNSDALIRDGEVYRHDWEGSPRFYHVRIYPHDPRECPAHPHLYTPRIKICVELEGDPTTAKERTPDDDADEINEAVFECIAEIEDMHIPHWEEEQYSERRQMEADYWRSRI